LICGVDAAAAGADAAGMTEVPQPGQLAEPSGTSVWQFEQVVDAISQPRSCS
jgi:hypothetical protein